MPRTIVVGDAHGCADEVRLLLSKCNASVMNGDRVIFAGDLIDRGSKNDECVDLAMYWGAAQGLPSCVLGNHENKHLEYEDCLNRTGTLPSLPNSHAQTRKQLTKKHFDYIRTLPTYIRLPEHNAVVVHAGVMPGLSIEEQSVKHLLHIQMIKREDVGSSESQSKWPSKVPEDEDWVFWTNLWKGPERVIFGHSVLNRPLLNEYVCGIDGGAVFGRQLHALILPDWRIVSVDATEETKNRNLPESGKNSRQGRVSKFIVHGDISTYSLK